ncbi:MAG: hypothetical protein ACYDIE_14705 [Candidatus Krumholzibacteriia bacterium]
MQDSHAPQRLPHRERRRGDARLPLPTTTPAGRLCLALLPAALLLLPAPPAAAIAPVIGSDPGISVSTGDPDDGEHRDLPAVKSSLVVTETLLDVAPPASSTRSLRSPVFTRGPGARSRLFRFVGLPGPGSLWSLLQTWFLHR